MAQWIAVEERGNPNAWYVSTEDGSAVTGWGAVTTDKATARRLAAAPEALKACHTLLMMEFAPEDKRVDMLALAIEQAGEAMLKAGGIP